MSWWVYGVNWAVLLVAALLALYALYRGPASLNRTIALDLLTAVSMGIIALTTVIHGRSDTMPIFIVMTLVAFLTSTSVARIVSQQKAARKQQALRKPSSEASLSSASADKDLGKASVKVAPKDSGKASRKASADSSQTDEDAEETPDLELSDLEPGGERDE